MKVLLAAVLALTGCIDPMEGLAYRTALGVGVFEQGLPDYFTPEHVDEEVQALIDRLVTVGYDRSKMLSCLAEPSHPNVWVVPSPYRCNDWTMQTCNGSQAVSTIIVVAKACRYETALIHEFTHYFQMCADGGTIDGSHTQTWVWEAASGFIRTCNENELWDAPAENFDADINNTGGVQ